jgi:phospholipase C
MLLLIVYDEHGGIFDHVFPPSLARAQNVIPFYMQPTLGGSDIDSVVGLRGFDNYRFRAPDAMFLQAEYDHPFGDQSEV